MNVKDLVIEHGVLMRQIGGLQRRATEQWQALQAENLRLRAELVILRTSVLWGLGVHPVMRRQSTNRATPRMGMIAHGTQGAQVVICQTGCAGHAHPWLSDDGQCLRSGHACDRLMVDAGLDTQADVNG